MNWWPFGKETAAKDGPQSLLEDLEKRGKRYLDDIDNGKFILACLQAHRLGCRLR